MMNISIISGASATIVAFVIIAIFLWAWAIINCMNSDLSKDDKLLWILIIILLNFIGSIIYLIYSSQKDNTVKNKTQKSKKPKALKLNPDNKVLFGVCGGIGKFFSIDPTIVRIIWVLFTLAFFGSGLLLYILLAIIIPFEKVEKNKKASNSKNSGGLVLVIFLVLLLVLFSTIIFLGQYTFKARNSSVLVSKEINVVDLNQEELGVHHILHDYNYINYGGHNLELLSIKRTDKNQCKIFENDPYGLIIYDSDCKKYQFRFDIDSNTHPLGVEGYFVNLIIVRNKVVDSEYIEIVSY